MKTSTGCALAIAALTMMLSAPGCGGGDEAPAKAPPVREKAAAKNAERPSPVAKTEKPATEAPQRKPRGDDKMAQRRHPRPNEISELPDNFPSDVPVYPESVPTASLVSGEQDFVVSFATSDRPPDVLRYYKKNLGNEGWRIESEADLGTQSALVTTKDQRTTTILVMEGPSETHITVTIANE
jgi:hypothetical protein